MSRLHAIAFTLVMLGLSGTALAAEDANPDPAQNRALRADTRVDMYFGGIKLGHVDMVTRLEGQAYAMEAKMRTGGLVGLFVENFADLESEGELIEGGVSPHEYRASYGKGDTLERVTKLIFEDSTAVMLEADPPYDKKNKAADYPLEEREGAIDPMSAALFGATARMQEGLCEGVIKIFDGRRRYNLKLSYVGESELSSFRKDRYTGKAEHCKLVFERLRWKQGDFELDPKVKTFGPYDIWFARFPAPDGGEEMLAPVKFVAPLEFGAVVAHMSKIDLKPLETAANHAAPN